jgi:RNA polymerase primary sigma factor
MHNMRYVVRLAKRYAKNMVSVGDLVSVGSIVLCNKVKDFDRNMGNKFITFVHRHLREAMRVELSKMAHPTRMPGKVEYKDKAIELDKPISNGSHTTMVEVMSGCGEEPDASAIAISNGELISEIIDQLTPTEAAILRQYYGVCGCQQRPTREVAEELGITVSRVNQIKARAMPKLRSILEERGYKHE